MRFSSIVFIVLLFISFSAIAQESAIITLSDIQAEYSPKNFYIQAVQDKRPDTETLGRLSNGTIDMENGVAAALMMYIDKYVQQDKSTLPVTMQLTRFEITEKQIGRKRQFDLNMSIAYFAGTSKLVEYNGSSFAQSMGEADKYIDQLIRDNITGNLKEFDNWMAQNKGSISATPTVEVNVVLAKTTDKSTFIPYNTSRKLTIGDFKGEPDMESPGAAATMSGVGMQLEASTLRNKTTVNVVVTIYFDKSRSWMKDNGKNPATLLHEQKHFDITAIKACQLKERIKQATFTPENYKAELKELLTTIENEGTDMQNQYDGETEHGTIAGQQQAWNEKIAEMMRKQRCY